MPDEDAYYENIVRPELERERNFQDEKDQQDWD